MVHGEGISREADLLDALETNRSWWRKAERGLAMEEERDSDRGGRTRKRFSVRSTPARANRLRAS